MTAESAGFRPSGESADSELTVVPLRHPLRWVAVAVIALLGAMFIHSLATNPAWEWSYVRGYFTDSQIVSGIWVTIQLTFLSMAIGVVFGIVLAIMRLSPNPIVRTSAWLYTWFFRGTPVLVQLFFWYYIALLLPRISIGVPFGPSLHSWDSNSLITAFTAAVLGLGLNEAAYMSEIARAGLLSVSQGQREAAAALGMSRGQAMRRIILPQAMRVIIPPTGNETISMLKTTSLVIVISLSDLTTAATTIYNQATFLQIPLLVVASLWYLFMTSILSIGQYFLERKFGRGFGRGAPERPLRRLLGTIRTSRGGEVGARGV